MKSLGQSIREGIGNYVTLKSAGEQSNLRKLQGMLALAKISQMGGPTPQGYFQYGGKLYPDIGAQLKILGNANIVPNQDQTNLGLGTNQRTLSRSTRGLKTLTLPTLSRSGLGFKQVFDPRDLMEMKSQQKKQEQIQKAQVESQTAENEIDATVSNLIGQLKSSNIETGGGGYFRGKVGRYLAKVPGVEHGGNVIASQEAITDAAILLAKRLSGGNRGAQLLFQKVLTNFPSDINTPEGQMTGLHHIYVTAHSLKKAVDNIGLEDISDMTPGQLSKASLSNSELSDLTNRFSNVVKNMPPRPEITGFGEARPPQTMNILRPFAKREYLQTQGVPSQSTKPSSKYKIISVS